MKKISESRVITVCSAISFIFALIGIAFAMLAKSESVLFDAVYSFGAGIFTFISSRVVKIVLRGDDRKYQFGYGSFEPFFIVVKSVFMLIMIILLLLNAIETIISGGNNIVVSVAAVYTVISAVLCILIAIFLKLLSRKIYSPLLAAEAKSWLYDGLLSIAVLAAFSVIIIFKNTAYAFIIPYVDPAVSLIFALCFLPSLIILFFSNLKELLIAAPSEEIQSGLDSIIQKYIEENTNLLDFETYSTKRGRNLYIVVHIYLATDVSVRSVDKIRKKIIQDIKKFWQNSDIDIIFTVDTSWIPLSLPETARISDTEEADRELK